MINMILIYWLDILWFDVVAQKQNHSKIKMGSCVARMEEGKPRQETYNYA